METAAWRTLPAYERAAFVEVAMIYDGANNGYLDMGVRRLAERLNVSINKASWCLQELVARGFLEIAQPGGFGTNNRRAASYRLTHQRCDRTHQPGSRAYQTWRPEKQILVSRGEQHVARGETEAASPSHEVRLAC